MDSDPKNSVYDPATFSGSNFVFTFSLKSKGRNSNPRAASHMSPTLRGFAHSEFQNCVALDLAVGALGAEDLCGSEPSRRTADAKVRSAFGDHATTEPLLFERVLAGPEWNHPRPVENPDHPTREKRSGSLVPPPFVLLPAPKIARCSKRRIRFGPEGYPGYAAARRGSY